MSGPNETPANFIIKKHNSVPHAWYGYYQYHLEKTIQTKEQATNSEDFFDFQSSRKQEILLNNANILHNGKPFDHLKMYVWKHPSVDELHVLLFVDTERVRIGKYYFHMAAQLVNVQNPEKTFTKTLNIRFVNQSQTCYFEFPVSWKELDSFIDNDNNILFDESYFKDAEGNEVVRSFYEFVRDHLGYRLNLQSESTVEAKNGNLEYNLTITNTGFATVINPKEVYLVLVSGDGQVAKEIKLDVDPKTWIPSTNEEPNQVAKYVIKGSAAAGLSGTYKVGIWMPEKVADLKYNPAYAIKFAPTEKLTHWYDDAGKYAVNIFGEVTF